MKRQNTNLYKRPSNGTNLKVSSLTPVTTKSYSNKQNSQFRL